MVGDLSAFGTLEQLTEDARNHWEKLTVALPDARCDQYPSVALGVFGSHHGIVHAADRDNAERRRVLAGLPRLLDDAARILGCRSSALLYATDEQAAALGPAAEALGYTPAVLGAESVLRFDAPDWDAYLAGLASRKRIRTKRELRAYAEAGFRTVIREGRLRPRATAGLVPLHRHGP